MMYINKKTKKIAVKIDEKIDNFIGFDCKFYLLKFEDDSSAWFPIEWVVRDFDRLRQKNRRKK